jgi:hypothetical protein
MMFLLFIPEGICFAAFVAFVARGYTKRKTIYNKAARRRQLNLKTY